MRAILHGPGARLGALLVFFAGCAAVLWVLYSGTGAHTPLTPHGYTISAVMDDVDNLVTASRVEIAGVRVGEVRSVTSEPDGTRVTFTIDKSILPLHRGASIRVGERSLVGESYLDLTDGHGSALASGTTLPASSVHESVQLHDVLASLDPTTRQRLQNVLRSTGQATTGNAASISQLANGMGKLGRQGYDAVDAIAAQSSDLKTLARQTTDLLAALDTGNGEIAALVQSANQVTAATAGQSASIEQTLRLAPQVLGTAQTASTSLTSLSDALAPVAKNLRAAAPSLTTALKQLPSTTQDLRGMLSPLQASLKLAPSTLQRVPTLSTDANTVIPTVQTSLGDLNPMLGYIKPYGPELAAYFANFNAVLNYTDENGASYLRLVPMVNDYSVQLPIKVGGIGGILGTYTNPYPAPGTGATPGPFKGSYPKVQREQ